MIATSEQRRLLALCAIRVPDRHGRRMSVDWSLLAREASRPGGLRELEAGKIHEQSKAATEARSLLPRGLDCADSAHTRVDEELREAEALGARLVTVLDDDYPPTLRLVWNLPPFLFILGGDFTEADLRSVAVVGTRTPSVEGVEKARRIAGGLAGAGVVVVSGLAKGVDSAAHSSTLDAGGRTIAVVGTGVCSTYPAENAPLADRIVSSGGLIVSQFWPTTRPSRWTFPRRNVVMSGIGQGTVVVEASSTSGAKMQARLATEHGKQVFLLQSLVTRQTWAQTYVEKRGAVEVERLEDILRRLASPERITAQATQRQLALDLA